MSVCKLWCDVARDVCNARRTVVPAEHDALLRAVELAQPGDTLLLGRGKHELSTELSIEKPLQLLPHTAPCAAAPGPSSMASGSSDAEPGAPPIVVSTHHVLVRIRGNAKLQGLTMLRMGCGTGYPNAVVSVESGRVCIDACRISCGGLSSGVDDALGAFGTYCPGTWGIRPRPAMALDPRSDGPHAVVLTDGQGAESAVGTAERRAGAAEVEAPQDPQSGVWVGAAAHVLLKRCVISCCMGPGIKIYRGKLDAALNTVAYSRCGGNVVANGGHVKLDRNNIHGAQGDGVVSWSNTKMEVHNNCIYDNTGSGVAIKAGGREVEITNNCVYNNQGPALMFAGPIARQARVEGNHGLDEEGNPQPVDPPHQLSQQRCSSASWGQQRF